MTVCADSSFFLSLYLPDLHTRRAAAALSSLAEPLLLTPLNELEIVNAIELRVFRKELTMTEATRTQSAFDADLAAGIFAVTPLNLDVFGAAIQLARKHSAALGSRSLDILHVAIAVSLRAGRFLSFDRAQNRLAQHAGLETI